MKITVFSIILSIALIASSPRAYAQQSFEIMQTGQFNEGAIFQKKLKDFAGAWYAVCTTSSGDQLVNVIVDVTEIGEQGGMKRMNVQAEGCKEVVFLVKNNQALKAGVLQTGTIEEVDMAANLSKASFNGIDIEIQKSDHGTERGYKLELTHSNKRQVIYSTEFTEESRGWGLSWVGDLDHDSLPDFLIHTSHKYSSHQIRLFTSGNAEAGALVKETAMIYIADSM